MKKSIFLTMGIIAMALTSCKEQATEQPWVVDRFDDVKIIRYEVPEFENQSLNDKILIYYLAEAAKGGRDIMFDQNFKYNLTIRRALEQIYTSYDGNKECPEFKAMEKYLKKVWFANGIHHHYSNDKFTPEFSEEWFRAQLAQYINDETRQIEDELLCRILFLKNTKYSWSAATHQSIFCPTIQQAFFHYSNLLLHRLIHQNTFFHTPRLT